MPMRLPRIAQSSRSLLPVSSSPSKRMLPVTCAFSGSKPMSAITLIDLPQPDSPTRPRVSPRSSEKLMSRTAYAGPRWVCSFTWRLLTSSRGIKTPDGRRSPRQSRVRAGRGASQRCAAACPDTTLQRHGWRSTFARPPRLSRGRRYPAGAISATPTPGPSIAAESERSGDRHSMSPCRVPPAATRGATTFGARIHLFLASRGSNRSRKPSPSRLSPSTARAIATPG